MPLHLQQQLPLLTPMPPSPSMSQVSENCIFIPAFPTFRRSILIWTLPIKWLEQSFIKWCQHFTVRDGIGIFDETLPGDESGMGSEYSMRLCPEMRVAQRWPRA
eukprot:GHVU01086803.1.p1 GENE.GHVU01086803.1~~GHVU01086803.1.p1  ORF type:complete len:104 (+),score=5.57 GHVU01086803.1:185-496(+)